MKNIIILISATALTFLSSCKKKYTCECIGVQTIVYVDDNGNAVKPTEYINIYDSSNFKLKKSDAEANCSARGASITSSRTYSWGESGIQP